MKKKEKIRCVYKKHGVRVNDETMEAILEDKKRTKALLHRYKEEKLESMNYILGRPSDNKVFTKYELKAMNEVDLFNRKVVEWCKLIWDNRNNEENLDEILNALTERRCPKCM